MKFRIRVKKYSGFAAALCLLALSLAGCGEEKAPDTIEVSTVSVSKKGQISMWFVEEFTEEYYNLAELTAVALSEVEEFNSSVGGKTAAVTMKKMELLPESDGKAMVYYQFDSWKSCTAFNEIYEVYENADTFFYGTVAEALREGFDAKVVLKNVKDGSLLAGDQFAREPDRRVVITDVKANIYCPSKVAYLSGAAVLNEDGSVDATQAEGLVYILLK